VSAGERSAGFGGDSGLPEASAAVLASIAQHRALSTEQVRQIHFPQNRTRWVQKVLARIEGAGFVGHVDVRRAPRRLWFATESGAELALADGALAERPRLFTAEEIGGRLWAHTHAVNDVAISFLDAARERGDDFGPLSWRHEVLHQVGPKGAPGRRVLIPDAVITYVRGTEAGEVFLEQRFLEVDRATRSMEGTASALAGYARLATFGREPGRGWRALYPSLPPVICVLGGAEEKTLARRRTTILALLRARPELSRAEEVRISICLASDLEREGPFAPIFGELREPRTRVNWLGRGPVG
jgi:hypothetical protein